MKTMKKTDNTFSFKRNTDVSALPQAKDEISPIPKSKGKPGRKSESDAGARKKQVSAYLTDEEWEKFSIKLDGRPASLIVRKLILNYIDHE